MKNVHTDRRSKYSLRVIQEALLEILEEKNLDSISVTEICEKADVNRGTFYKYYRDIYELYDQIEDQFVDNLRELFAKTAGQDQEAFFTKVTIMLQSNKSFLRPRYRGDGSARLLGKLLALVLPSMTDHVLRHCRNLSQEEARFLGEYIIGGCARIYEIWIREGMSTPAERIQKYVASFVEGSLQLKK